MTERPEWLIRGAFAVILAMALSSAASAAPSPQGDVKKPAPAKAPAKAAESDPDLALSRKAAVDWLALVDAGKFDATWDEAATSLQKAQNKADWTKGLGASRPTMGKLISREFLNQEVRTVLPNLPPGKYITVRFSSVFEKNKEGRESVTVIRDGARGFRTMSYFLK